MATSAITKHRALLPWTSELIDLLCTFIDSPACHFKIRFEQPKQSLIHLPILRCFVNSPKKYSRSRTSGCPWVDLGVVQGPATSPQGHNPDDLMYF